MPQLGHSARCAVMAFLLVLATLTGCGSQAHNLVVAGSTSVQPAMEKIVEAFRASHPGIKVTVEGGGSSAGITAVLTGAAQLGMSSRELKAGDPREEKVTPHLLAYDAICIIVHPSNPVASLSMDGLRDLFSGRIRNWQELGGSHREIHLIIREEGSGTRSAFDELVMKDGKAEVPIDAYALVQDSSGGVREVVRQDPGAIGFISFGVLSPDVKALPIEGNVPALDTVRAKTYRLVRPFFILSVGQPASIAQELLSFALGSAAQPILLKEGLVAHDR